MDHRGISAVATAVILLLQRSWNARVLSGAAPEFAVYQSRDFADPMRAGLSVFVHQVSGAAVEKSLRTVLFGLADLWHGCPDSPAEWWVAPGSPWDSCQRGPRP